MLKDSRVLGEAEHETSEHGIKKGILDPLRSALGLKGEFSRAWLWAGPTYTMNENEYKNGNLPQKGKTVRSSVTRPGSYCSPHDRPRN